jgi:hypothetical protein
MKTPNLNLKNNTQYGVVKVKSGTVILNNISYDEKNGNCLFDYTIDENISEEIKNKIEEELKEYFDTEIKKNFLNFINSKIIK